MDFLQFAVERYNYWIFIVLMMTGLYTVISRGNLVKKLIGLNIFQTSVFIYYISIGKIAGGTAPIYVAGDMEARTDHGGGHGADHDGAGSSGVNHGADAHASASELHEAPADLANGHANELSDALAAPSPGDAPPAEALHSAAGHANASLADIPHDVVMTAADPASTAHAASEIIYSNPLPHVLILTAIVVGVATTAVGLALAVRIREAYGTIEEDELEAADNIAEFGVADPAAREVAA